MRIPIRDENQRLLGVIPVKIKIASGETERITVQVHRLNVPKPRKQIIVQEPEAEPPEQSEEASETSSVSDENPVLPDKDPAAESSVKTIEIKITLPSLSKLTKLLALKGALLKTNRKVLAIAGAISLLLILSIGYTIQTEHDSSNKSGKGAIVAPQELVRGTPDYPTVLPSGKSIDSLGGWVRISPPDRDPVYTYADKIDTTRITVSEQPLPEAFKTNTAESLKQLAVSFNATEKITTDQTTIYIGNSVNGPQSVIFNKDNLLILIKADTPLTNDQWTAYISNLR